MSDGQKVTKEQIVSVLKNTPTEELIFDLASAIMAMQEVSDKFKNPASLITKLPTLLMKANMTKDASVIFDGLGLQDVKLLIDKYGQLLKQVK